MTVIDLTKGWDTESLITGPYMASVVAPISEVDSPLIETSLCTWEITAQIRWVDDMYGNAQLQYEMEISDHPSLLLYSSQENLEDAYNYAVAAKKEELANS